MAIRNKTDLKMKDSSLNRSPIAAIAIKKIKVMRIFKVSNMLVKGCCGNIENASIFLKHIIIVGYIPCGYSQWSFSLIKDKVVGMKVTLPALKQALSANIKRIRLEQGISQEKLALKADLDRSYMSEMERQLANPSIEALLRIANALEVTPSDLVHLGKKKS